MAKLTICKSGAAVLDRINDLGLNYNHWAIFIGSKIASRSIADNEKSRELLEYELNNLDNDAQEYLLLCLYDKPESAKYQYKTDNCFYNVSFCTAAYGKNNNKQIAISGIDPNLFNKLQALEEKINNLDKSISGVDDEEPEDKTMLYLTKANDILNNPFIAGVIGKIFNVNFNQPTALAGIDESEVLQNAINVLMSKGVTLDHIVKLSQLPGDKIKMLLTML